MIVIVDYGMGNLRSVQKAGEFLRKRVKVSDSAMVIEKADKIILPGVGHFGKAVNELKKRKIVKLLKEKIKDGIPFLGICVGMQLLFEESEEAPGAKGLGVIKGKVKKFRRKNLIIPHMGWNQIRLRMRDKKNSIFTGIKDGSWFYFAHSYYCAPKEKETVLSTTDYGGQLASSVHKHNVWAVQFHPEKSQALGLKVFDNFLKV